jgi:CubicO group peptidase (beta-lactamase class C family)
VNRDSINERVEKFVAQHDVPGLALGILHQGKSYLYSYGFRDVAKALPVTEKTIFGIASLTKSFTALTLLKLEQEGLLSLQDPLTKHLPDFSYPGMTEPIRLKHLLSHSSGLPSLPALTYAITPESAPVPMQTIKDLLNYLASSPAPLIAAPGKIMSYQNDGYALLGEVIARVTTQPYAQVVQEKVLEPLACKRSVFALKDAHTLGNVTELYETSENKIIHSPTWEEAPTHLATGFLKSSVEDLLGVLAIYLDSKETQPTFLNSASLREMFTPRVRAEPNVDYGYGWAIHDYTGLTLYRHGGSLKGVSSHWGFVPELSAAVVISCNLEDVPVKSLFLDLIDLLVSRETPTPIFLPDGNEMLQMKIVGSYRSLEPWGKFNVVREGENLIAYAGEKLLKQGILELHSNGEFMIQTPTGLEGGKFFLEDEKVRGVQYGWRWLERVE